METAMVELINPAKARLEAGDLAEVNFILAPFTQRNVVETASEGGTGLGLPIVKSLIELHGGRIDIESRLGEGTKVTLFFPEPTMTARRLCPASGGKA